MSKKKKTKNKLSFLIRKIRCGIIFLVLVFFCFVLLFRIVPVPFSSYMAQQKISHLIEGETYPVHYQWVSLNKISPYMQLAVMSSEDQRFPEHYGFDWDAIENALKHNKKSKKTRGGSTISQQTAKNLFLWHNQSWFRKGLEVPVTLSLEMLWNKKRILEVYLNIAEFGYGIFGVEAASQHYFKKSAKSLNKSEAALLAAVLPNPIIFKVNKPSAYVKRKQYWIMKQMNLLGQSYLKKLD